MSIYKSYPISELLSYDPETGKLYWLERKPYMFSHTKDMNKTCKWWNSANAGNEALTAVNKDGYKSGTIWGVYFSAHRAAWEVYYGSPPEFDIDHINMDKSDNRISNLRQASKSENNSNKTMQKNNTSGHKGVFWEKDRCSWRVMIRSNGILHRFGRYADFDDAVAVHEREIHKLHGEFTRIE